MKKIVYGLLVLLMAVTITGCKKEETKEDVKKTEVSYHLVEMSNDSEIYKEADIKKLDLNYELVMSLVNNNATLKLGEYTLNLTFNDKEFVDETSEEKLTYEKNGNRVTVNYNGEKMVFEEN